MPKPTRVGDKVTLKDVMKRSLFWLCRHGYFISLVDYKDLDTCKKYHRKAIPAPRKVWERIQREMYGEWKSGKDYDWVMEIIGELSKVEKGYRWGNAKH